MDETGTETAASYGTLSMLFPEHSISSLHSTLLNWRNHCFDANSWPLIRQRGDPTEIDDILTNIVIVAPLQLPVLQIAQRSENLVYFLSMRFNLDQTARRASTDMLDPRISRSNSRKLESQCVWDEFSKPTWNLLFRRLGDDVFAYLFDHCHLFRTLPNFNFLQLAGANLIVRARMVPPETRLAQSASTSVVTRLQSLKSRALANQEEHEGRLEQWKKKRRFSEHFAPGTVEVGLEMAVTTQYNGIEGPHLELGPPEPKRVLPPDPTTRAHQANLAPPNNPKHAQRKSSAYHNALMGFGQYKHSPAFLNLPRHAILYKHCPSLLYGFPANWEPKLATADANGASAMANWIFGVFAPNVCDLESLLIGFIKRVKRIKVRVLLEKSCPLIPVEAAEAAIEIPKPDLPLMSPNLFTQRPNRGRVSNPNDSTFLINPEDIDFSSTEQGPRFDPRKFHSDHPLLMSSGVGVGHLFTHATVSASDHSKSDQGSILTQMSAVQNSSNSDPSIGRETIPRLQCRADSGEMFDINNNEDYLLTLLMEPERDPFEGWNLQELVSHSCSPLQVASFIISCVNQLIPRSFLGSDENWRLLEAKIKHFIRLNRFDVLSSKQLLEGFHITDIYWCYGDKQTYGIIPRKTATDTQKATVLFHKFLVWLFEHLIMVLLRSNFYVTETMAFRNRLFYYRNEVWRSIRKQGFESLVSKGLLVPISDLEAKEILKRRELGACSLRFVPKATGLRPIVNLKKKFSNPEKTDFASSINELLAPVHAIVTHEATKNPSKILASSCMRHDEVHTRLSQFRNSVRSLFKSTPSSSHTSQDDLPPLFFVKLDIISAFDEIQQSKLMNILRQDVLIMERYISSLSSKLRVNRGRWTQSGIKTFVGPHEKVEMSEMLSGHLSKFSNSILATTATSEFATRDKLLSLLEEHITQHLIQSEGRYYLQKQGIPQGSILSSLLCSVYFGCLEKTYLSEYLETSVDQTTGKAKDASILLRWVDDFLYITTDRMKAVRFFERMHAGFDDFGTRCNPAKSSVNFPLSFRGEQVLNISFNTSNVQSTQFAGEIGEEDEEVWASANEMIWCGWLFDTRTLHIRKSIPTRIVVPEMVTTILSNRPGHSMSEKCHASVANAIHLILFDGTFNTRQVILENVFDIFAWTCLRMIAIERNMHFSTSLLPNGDPNLPALPNPKFITDLLFSLAQKFSSTLWKRISSPKAAQVKFNTKISPKDISALSLYAARAILLDHGFIRFRKVIDTLEAMINTKERENQSEQQNEEFSLVVAHRAPLFASAIF